MKYKLFYGKTTSHKMSDPERPWIRQFAAVVCTTSRKKVAELTGSSENYVKDYWSSMDLNTPNRRGRWAVEHPDILWAWVEDFGDNPKDAVEVARLQA